MSKQEILAELPKLRPGERREIFERNGELEELDLLHGSEPSPEEKSLLDNELAEHPQRPDSGSPWNEVKARIRKSQRP